MTLKKLIKFINKTFLKRLSYLAILFVLFFLTLFTVYNIYFVGKIFPNISLAEIDVGGHNLASAYSIVSQNIKAPQKVILVYKDRSFEINTQDIGLTYDINESVQSAYELTRTGNVFYDLTERLLLIIGKKNLGLSPKFDEEKLQTILSAISGQVSEEEVLPSVKISAGKVEVTKGTPGFDVDTQYIRAQIGYNLSFLKTEPIIIQVKSVDHTLTNSEVLSLTQRSQKLIGKSLTLTFESKVYSYKDADLVSLLDPENEYKKNEILKIVEEISKDMDRDPQNPVFIFEGGKVKEFSPAKDGVVVKENSLVDSFVGNLRTLETSTENQISVEVPVISTPPSIKTEEVNNLGIKELIGRGTSHFTHSIPNRIHNISLASSKFKGVLVKPGEIFSFNQTLGDVSTLTGYKQAYIINEGKTVLGDGGGVCQVSTTFFRAALNAGLPILERAAHAYRVGYYEQDSPPGLDATVYDPTPDLKIKNDTPGYILIQPTVDTKNVTLTFDIYGTNDGRVAKTTKPVITDQVPPPEDIYQDDPSLPLGTIKQTEYRAWGAKVTFNYTVERGGEVIYQKKFISNYRPWAAVYLRGTGPSN